MLEALEAGLLVLQEEAAPLARATDKLDKKENSACQGTTSYQINGPGGS